ncbi:MAG: glycoside hydrolase family 57 protein [bacterium]
MKKSIVLYLHAHQPYRVKDYSVFEVGKNHDYFSWDDSDPNGNQKIIDKVSEKSYIPTNKKLIHLLKTYPEFKVSMSITGTLITELEKWAPEVLQSFVDLVKTGKVEIVAETYHHSLAFFYSLQEFEIQVRMHREKIESIFGQTPKVFRNTELAYNNDLAIWADKAGYKGILAEGWDKVLGWRNSNHLYKPINTQNIKLLMKNYKLSDDIAFRFGNRNWNEWPLTADKYINWINDSQDSEIFNLFMDYETFGEHQWEDTGIFDFLENMVPIWLKDENNTFMTVSDAIDSYKVVDTIDVPETVTWADTERDLSAWLGNAMQQQAIKAIYSLSSKILGTDDWSLIEDWRRLQTSDHFYYMCTKYFNDGDIHAYFSPYKTPYDATINFMNAWHDLRFRLNEKGVEI